MAKLKYRYGQTSLGNLVGVHPKLVNWAFDVIYNSPMDIGVSDGLRTPEEQLQNIRDRVSWTMDSMHLPRQFDDLPDGIYVAGALDIYIYGSNGKATYQAPLYEELWEDVMVPMAKANEIELEWGGHWEGAQRDLPHVQLASPNRIADSQWLKWKP